LNKIYKVVFNHVTATWQVVSETASSQGGGGTVVNESASIVSRRHIGIFAMLTALSPCAMAASMVLTGNYIKIGVNDAGTLGYNGRTSPGILYDGTGTGTFNTAYDYLTPGTPFEGFTVKGTGTSTFSVTNNNTSVGSPQVAGTLTNYSGVAHAGSTYDNRTIWTGTYGSQFTVTNEVYFNNTDQQVNIKTTITALTDITGLQFGRFTDPDARAATGDSSATTNIIGATGVPSTDLVYAEALVSKYVIGLYTSSSTSHGAGVSSAWSTDPNTYYTGTNNGNGDYTIGLGFNIGSLLNGNSIELNYAYIFGTNISAAVSSSGAGGGGSATPTIDTAKSNYTSTELSAGSVTPTFDGGTLALADSGNVTSNFSVKASGGTIDTAGQNSTFSGTISNDGADTTGTLTKSGSGTLTLSGANTYTGATQVSAGTLNLTGSLASTSITVASGATLQDGAGGLSSSSNVTVNGTLSLGANEAISQLGGSGAVNVGSHTLSVDQGTFSGDVSGTGGLTKTGAGTLTLSGSNALTGATTVSAGTLSLTGSLASTSVSIASGATLQDSSGGLAANAVVNNAGTLTLGANQTISQLDGAGGVNLGSHTLSLSQGTYSGSLSGTGGLSKQGSGLLTLSGTSNYSGATIVQGGTLAVQGNLAASQVTVMNGGTLGGSGRIGSNVLVQSGGTLSPGSSPGVMTVAGNVTLTSGSTFRVEVDGYGLSGGAGGFDRVILTGTGSTFTASGTLTPVMRGISGAATNTFTAAIGDVFPFVEASDGAVVGQFDAIVQPTTGGLPANTRFQVIYEPTRLLLAVTPDQYGTSVASAGGNTNAVSAATALDGVRPSGADAGQAAINRFFVGLAGRTESQLAGIFSSLSGQVHANVLSESNHDSARMRNAIFTRKPTSLCVDDESDCRYAWLSVDHGRVNVDADAAAYGIRTTSDLISAGLERRVNAQTVYGVALGIQTGSQTPEAASDQSSNQGLQLAGYMDKQTAWGQYTQILGLGVTQHDTQRAVTLSDQTAHNSADYKSWRVFSDSRLTRELISKGAVSIRGLAGLRLDYVHRGAVDEGGSAETALSLAAHDHLYAQGNLGVALRHTYVANASHTGYAELDLTYNHQLDGKGYAASRTSLHGADWSARSANHGAESLDMGLSISDVGKRHSMSLRVYCTQSRSGISDAGVQLTGGIQW
jgi:autotransporter-associated beta strand protein